MSQFHIYRHLFAMANQITGLWDLLVDPVHEADNLISQVNPRADLGSVTEDQLKAVVRSALNSPRTVPHTGGLDLAAFRLTFSARILNNRRSPLSGVLWTFDFKRGMFRIHQSSERIAQEGQLGGRSSFEWQVRTKLFNVGCCFRQSNLLAGSTRIDDFASIHKSDADFKRNAEELTNIWT
jgi:hypothetical protein